MRSFWSHRIVFITIICCLCFAAVGTVASAEGYDLQAENEIETPEESVTFEGESITIDHIGVFDVDESIVASVTAPSDSHNVELRNSDRQVLDVEDEQSDGRVIFDAEENDLDPGSYMLLLFDQNYQDGTPVVVSGYDIDATATEDTESSELTISATVTPTASSGQPESVEAVIWDGDTEERIALDGSDDSYEETISISAFDDGSYEVYVSAVGDEPLYNDENEILGISEATVTDNSDSDDEDDGDATDPGDSNDDGSDDDGTDDATDDDELNDDDAAEDDADNDTEEDDTDDEDTSEDDDSNESDTDDDDAVIQPTDSDDDQSTDDTDEVNDQTDDETPLSPITAIVALLTAAVLLIRRSE